MFTLKISTGNAAYRDEYDPEEFDSTFWQIRENLDQVSAMLEEGRTFGRIFDINGNQVGKFELEEED